MGIGVNPNKVTFEHFLRVLIRCDGIKPLDAAAQAEAIMAKLKTAGVEADMHTFSLMAKIYAVTGSKEVESRISPHWGSTPVAKRSCCSCEASAAAAEPDDSEKLHSLRRRTIYIRSNLQSLP